MEKMVAFGGDLKELISYSSSSASSSSRQSGGMLPVFAFPTSLTFYSDDQQSLKQVLTLYNPYEFPVKFKVLSTSPRKYNVIDPEGTIKSGNCTDIVIRIIDVSPQSHNKPDQFRIYMQRHFSLAANKDANFNSVSGKRDITATLLPTKLINEPNDSEFEQMSNSTSSSATTSSLNQYNVNETTRPQGTTLLTQRGANNSLMPPNPVITIIAILCIIILMIPTADEASQYLPIILHPTFNYKLVAAYTLGMVTMVIFRS